MYLRYKLNFLLVLALVFAIKANSLPSLDTFTSKEIEILNEELGYLFDKQGLGDTLFGDKAIQHLPLNSIQCDQDEIADAKLSPIIATLKKLSCETKHFKVDYRHVAGHLGTSDYKEFVIINKEALKNAIRENLSSFREKTGLNFSEERIFSDILGNRCEYLNQEISLRGLLAGYGFQNSLMYEEYGRMIEEVYNKTDLEIALRTTEDSKKQDQIFDQYLADFSKTDPDKWEDLYEKGKQYNQLFFLGDSYINLPCFPNSRETLKIIANHRKASSIVNKELETKTPLEVFLSAIAP